MSGCGCLVFVMLSVAFLAAMGEDKQKKIKEQQEQEKMALLRKIANK